MTCTHAITMPLGFEGRTFTYDCPHEGCGELCFHTEDGRFLLFHEAMNERDPRWPKDGSNTGYFDLEL